MKKKEDKLFDALKEIGDLVKKLKKDSFSIKGSPYEVCKQKSCNCVWFMEAVPLPIFTVTQMSLKREAARLFCTSLTRDPTSSDDQVCIRSVACFHPTCHLPTNCLQTGSCFKGDGKGRAIQDPVSFEVCQIKADTFALKRGARFCCV